MKNVGSKPFQIPARRDHLVEKFGGNEKASGLPCPMLSTLVNEDLLVPDENGEVSLDALKSALGAVGVTPFIQGVLASGGAKATGTTEKQVVNLLKLQGSSLDHRGSLGPLQDGGFNEGFLDQLKSYSSDGKSLTLEDLAVAQKVRTKSDKAALRDSILGQVEITALFLVLGTENAQGQKSISLEDVDRIFRDNKLPENFEPQRVGVLAMAWNTLKLAWKQNIGSASSRAEKGLRDALSEQGPIDTTSMMGLGAMCPAGMRPKEGMGATPADVSKLHENVQPQQTHVE